MPSPTINIKEEDMRVSKSLIPMAGIVSAHMGNERDEKANGGHGPMLRLTP